MTQMIDRPIVDEKPSNGGAMVRQPRQSALAAMASRFQIEPARLMQVLKSTIIKAKNRQATDDEAAAFIVVANQYRLNPFTREIHAFADSDRGIVPIVGIDGWAHLVNDEPRFNGCEFDETESPDGKPLKTTCLMHVQGREHPIKVTERYAECKRNTGPWNQMPFRMLRHKSFMQAARLAFSISGIYDEDEARDIIEGQLVSSEAAPPERGVSGLAKRISSRPVSDGQQLVNEETGEVLQSDGHHPEPSPSAPSESDVAAEDAQPPVDPLGPGAVTEAAQQPPKEMTDNEKWMAGITELAADKGIPDSQLKAGLIDWRKRANVMERKEYAAKERDRKALTDAMGERSGFWVENKDRWK